MEPFGETTFAQHRRLQGSLRGSRQYLGSELPVVRVMLFDQWVRDLDTERFLVIFVEADLFGALVVICRLDRDVLQILLLL